jgi:hypothetical protein
MNRAAEYPKQVARGRAPMRARMRAAFTAAAVMAVALTVLAAPAAAGSQVPFRGTLEGVETTTSITPGIPPIPPMANIQGTGTGRASHLGLFTYDNPHVVNLGTRHAIGSWVFTAANGDTVIADVVGDATIVSGTPPFAILSIVETLTITGGTGRFTGATGSVTVERSVDQTTGATTGSFEGTISSPGASKH